MFIQIKIIYKTISSAKYFSQKFSLTSSTWRTKLGILRELLLTQIVSSIENNKGNILLHLDMNLMTLSKVTPEEWWYLTFRVDLRGHQVWGGCVWRATVAAMFIVTRCTFLSELLSFCGRIWLKTQVEISWHCALCYMLYLHDVYTVQWSRKVVHMTSHRHVLDLLSSWSPVQYSASFMFCNNVYIWTVVILLLSVILHMFVHIRL